MKSSSFYKLFTMALMFVSYVGFSQTTVNFNCTGGPQYWTVPPCVTSIDVVMAGGEGGGGTGGNGATVSATIPVTPGDVFEVNVGCQGACPGGSAYMGGGASGGGTGANAACGGGGASSIEFPPYTMADAIMVAAGGGGMGGGNTDEIGGAGGCATGGTGGTTWGGPGGGATSSSGGAGGPPWGGGSGGSAGGFGFGGAGGVDVCFGIGAGGGGGGGYYGGGGGGSDCWSGGSLGGGGGGGGSSLTPGGGTCTAGNNTGNGYVSITYTGGTSAVAGTAALAPSPICEGDDVTLTLAGYTGTIQWQSGPAGGGGPWTNIAGATTTPFVVTGVTASTCYQAVVTTACPPSVTSNVVCVTVDPLPTPANAGPDQSICGTTATLAGNVPVDGTGAWTVVGGGSTVTTPTAANSGVTGLTVGLNTYTWTITSGVCPPSTDNITITAAFPVNAGADNNTSICNTAGSSVDLNTLLSGADPGGTWAETTGSGAFTPGTGILNTDGLAAGVYSFTYTMTGTFPCPNDVADFTVTVEQEVNAGADNNTSICNVAGSSVDLNTLLSGADPGGAWVEITASGAFTPGTGVLNTDGLAAGTYDFTYTMTGVAPCPSDVSNFSVTVEQEVDAGLDNSVTSCDLAGSSVDVNTLLFGADPGGVWTETTSSGAFTPGTGILNTSGLTAGAYTFDYTVTGVAPCPNDVATMTVFVSSSANAGADDLTITICNTAGSSVDLNVYLSGADPGGTWAETSASGAFTPPSGILDTDGLPAGAYTFTYTVFPAPPCPIDFADFTVTVEQEADAGADNTATICNSAGSSIDVNTLLSGADPGGTWAETTGSGAFVPATGIFTAGGLAPGVYNFEYTAFGVAPCTNDVASFDVTVSNLPNAGLDGGPIAICNVAGSTVDINTSLSGADPGGTWTETTGSGAFTPGTGILVTDGLPAGLYSFNYDLAAVGACPGDQSIHTVQVEQEVDAGLDNSTAICNTAGSTVDMNTLLSGADPGGAWAETSGSGAFTPGTGILNTDALAAGVYTFTYTMTAIAPCVNDVSNFTVTVEQEVNAGPNNTSNSCNNGGATVDVNTLLVGADPGGIWNEVTGSGSFTPGTGIFDMSGLPAGDYLFNYTMNAVAPCLSDVSTMTVTVVEVPTIDVVSDEEVCDNDVLVSQTFTSSTVGTTFTWENITGTDVGFGVGPTGGSSIGSFTGSTGSTGDVTVTVEVTPSNFDVATGLTCVGVPTTFDITVHPLPQVGFSANEYQGCEPFNVTFTNDYPGIPGNTCFWQFGDGSTSSTCDITNHEYQLAGIYGVALTVTTAYGCSDMVNFLDLIEVYPEAVADFTFNPTSIDVTDTRVDFTNNSTDASGYIWEFGDESSNSTESDPTHTFPEVGNVSYTVTLTALSPGGCDDQISKLITIDDVIIFYVPNVFTPDGDQYNEEFKPIMVSGYDVYDYHMTIFNRWGEVVFESFNAAFGWDGSYGSQGLVEDGTYIWQIEFGETMSDKKHKHRGHVTILK